MCLIQANAFSVIKGSNLHVAGIFQKTEWLQIILQVFVTIQRTFAHKHYEWTNIDSVIPKGCHSYSISLCNDD